MLPRDKPVNVIAIVDNLELKVPNRLPKDAEEKPEEVAVVTATEETVADDKVRARGTRSCRRKLTTRQQQTRRRNPVRSVTRKESERRRQQQQQQQQRGGGGTRAPSREKPTSEPEEVGAEYEAPTVQDEMQWRPWPAHGMHERPVYHPQFGLAAEYNGRLFASFDGQRYREVVDLEVVRVDPRPAVVETAKKVQEATFTVQQQRALEQLRSLQRLRLQPSSAIPMCDVQPFKHNGNGKLFFVKAPVQKLQRVAALPTCTNRPTRPTIDLASTQVLDLSNKSRQPSQQTEPPPPPRKGEQRQQNPGCTFNLQQWPTSANSLNLVRYFQNFGADGSIDDAPQNQSASAHSNTLNTNDAHPSQR